MNNRNPDFPIFDNHVHLQLTGKNIEAVKEFTKVGGTHFILVNLPYPDIKINTGDDFEKQYNITLKIASLVHEKTSAKCYCALGPYPVILLDLLKEHRLEEAMEIMCKGVDIAKSYILEKKAVAIGEIGRPHFPVSQDIINASNKIIEYIFQTAKEINCPVIMHTESATLSLFREFSDLAKKLNFSPEKIIKHFSGPFVLESENFGIFPSILASKENILEALRKKSTRFFMETDYLDDLKRPGAVLDIKIVPKRTIALHKEGLLTDKMLFKIHKENPEKMYGLEL